ncbi:putative AbiEi antitoxin of type IV toxin-antitoxin system [Kribbella sp. VKM Ac-2569]|uniref:type IV toxin-antitoxin system AbiEi family antitoxin domain-containing protein n=1 Tax=Kribbella sp. VKM Ac-2569 TaxID=2512220 RepID=UPI00102B10B9|nr:type IV toxin-antitoxin system AbiEi family antitoxin domain-containing protein [Kribbella sp. VKM Ac-2569]RZT13388.1 putative AbiEi antitoxin of type IV toxin-antitoxin system [Kribbella sp. VKM Ac-2569]
MFLEVEREFEEVLRRQLGAFSRAQANASGMSDRSLAARSRAGRIQRLYRGAYVHFSGPVPWETRLWAAWLAYGPEAALAGETALRQYGIDRAQSEVIQLEIPHRRRLRGEAGVVITRTRDFADRVLGSREPPMVRLEVAVLTVASRRSRPDDAAALVLDVCRQRRTTPQRLLAELARMQQLPRHGLLVQVLRDAADGVQSFLELFYLRKVERAHGLPAARRQVRVAGEDGVVYRDTEYDYDLIVELDGRTGHEDARSRWRDMTRDNTALMAAKATLRFGYQIVSDPCGAAVQVATVLRARGWPGLPTACGPECPIGLGNAANLN